MTSFGASAPSKSRPAGVTLPVPPAGLHCVPGVGRSTLAQRLRPQKGTVLAASPVPTGLADQKRRVTAADVAKLAGCSQAAVSLWVTGKFEGRLAPEWQERIAAAVDELGYVPNKSARNLVRGTVQSVSLVFPGASYSFLGPVLEGVTDALGQGWDISVLDSRPGGDPNSSARAMSSAIGADTSGVIIASPSAADIEAVDALGFSSVVIVDSPRGSLRGSLVSFDFENSIDDLSRELAEYGHERVAYVSFAVPSLTLAHRREELRASLSKRHVELVDSDLIVVTTDVIAVKRAFVKVWPGWRKQGVTAVVCADDRHALGVISAARELGLTIPTDFSLAAFNDSEPAEFLDPALSSIRLPAMELGQAAAQALLGRVRSDDTSVFAVPTRYLSRASTGVAPQAG